MIRHVAWALAFVALAMGPAKAQDAAELLVRVGRLESQIRQLSGQIEQLQFQNRKLEDQLRKFQQDVEFRFQEQGGARLSPGANAPAAPTVGSAPAAGRNARGRGDAFDPLTQPGAPGAPRALGSPEPTSPAPAVPRTGAATPGRGASLVIEDESDGEPLDLSTTARGQAGATLPVPPAAVPQAGAAPGAAPDPSARGVVASAGTGLAKDDYDLAYGLLTQRQYEQAEMAFRQFLNAWPRDPLVANATYWLGETYFQRKRYPDALEQYLTIYKSFGSSRVAPESMLKMALSLRGMGETAKACNTLAEIGRRYPQAGGDVKVTVEREMKRVNC